MATRTRRRPRKIIIVRHRRRPSPADDDGAGNHNDRCLALTRTGKRCRRRATLGGGGTCWQHIDGDEPHPPSPSSSCSSSSPKAASPPTPPPPTCPICFDSILQPLQLGCTHAYHRRCIVHWAATTPDAPTCPVCRTPFEPEDLEEEWHPPESERLLVVVRRRGRIRLRPHLAAGLV